MSSAVVFFSVSTFELRRTTRNGVHSCSAFIGSRRPINQRRNSATLTFKPPRSTVCMEWQDCTVKREINVPVSVAYNCYLDREAVPRWMPFISSVKVQAHKQRRKGFDEPDHVANTIGGLASCDPEFSRPISWLTADQGIILTIMPFFILEDKPELSWWSLKYEAFGRDLEFSWLAHYMQPIPNQKIHWRSLEGLPNRGAVRFFPKGSSTCLVELTVSYEVPQFLSPVASILQPFNENLMRRSLERFANYARAYQLDSV